MRSSSSAWGVAAAGVSLFLLLCVGCGSDGTFPVSGSLKLQNGEPLAGASIVFRGSGKDSFRGSADAGGKFALRANPKASGLAPGTYKVVIQEAPSGDVDSPDPPKIAYKYFAGSTTDLEATVAEQDNVFNFTLDPPAARQRR